MLLTLTLSTIFKNGDHISMRSLVVGAGGIGCELLKNMVLSGFVDIEVIDLDTIDLSNLNRQFLFQKQHIKQSKSMVARNAALKFNPKAQIKAYHANIKEAQFSIKYFKSFDVVFNALDNLDARQYVNRMCLYAKVPLIESGTTGFKGQVEVIRGSQTECYACTEKELPKTFPVCTIRSTPNQPIHCIVWAKSWLFSQLFGEEEEELEPQSGENKEELEKLATETKALNSIRSTIGSNECFERVFKKVYVDDIERLAFAKEAFANPPKPLDFEQLISASVDKNAIDNNQIVLTPEENVAKFQDSLEKLSHRFLANSKAPLNFDKDDDDALAFVAAASNLRALCFNIKTNSEFEIKQMAGNIIPAIATTNAIIAGLCVLQAKKLLAGKADETKTVYLSKRPERVLNSEKPQPPNPSCVVCGDISKILIVNTDKATIGEFIGFLVKTFGYSTEVSLVGDKLIYDIDFDDNIPRSFREMGVIEGKFLTVSDEADEEDQKKNVTFIILEMEASENAAANLALGDDESLIVPLKEKEEKESSKEIEEHIAVQKDSVEGATGKRKLDSDAELPLKKRKTNGIDMSNGNGHVIIDLEDDSDIEIS